MVTATQSEFYNNEDAKSTSSTIVSEEQLRNNANEEMNGDRTQIRHGFDLESYEEDIIHFLYFSEKRHETNAKPNSLISNNLKDWVSDLYCNFSLFLYIYCYYVRGLEKG